MSTDQTEYKGWTEEELKKWTDEFLGRLKPYLDECCERMDNFLKKEKQDAE